MYMLACQIRDGPFVPPRCCSALGLFDHKLVGATLGFDKIQLFSIAALDWVSQQADVATGSGGGQGCMLLMAESMRGGGAML